MSQGRKAAASTSAEGDPGNVVVRVTASGFEQEILIGRHRIFAGEPVAVGGTDTGPTPYDLLLAALGDLHFDDRGDVRSTESLAAGRGNDQLAPLESAR